MDDIGAIEEPLLRPDIRESEKIFFEKIVSELGLDGTMIESQSYQELMAYCFLCYMELVPIPPSLKSAWKLEYLLQRRGCWVSADLASFRPTVFIQCFPVTCDWCARFFRRMVHHAGPLTASAPTQSQVFVDPPTHLLREKYHYE
jgi:hypothetical protein